MTIDELKAAVTNFGGEQHVIGFIFDNSSRIIFDDPVFTFATHYHDASGCLFFKDADTHGHPYTIVKHIENIQSVIFIDNIADFDDFNKRYIGA